MPPPDFPKLYDYGDNRYLYRGSSLSVEALLNPNSPFDIDNPEYNSLAGPTRIAQVRTEFEKGGYKALADHQLAQLRRPQAARLSLGMSEALLQTGVYGETETMEGKTTFKFVAVIHPDPAKDPVLRFTSALEGTARLYPYHPISCEAGLFFPPSPDQVSWFLVLHNPERHIDFLFFRVLDREKLATVLRGMDKSGSPREIEGRLWERIPSLIKSGALEKDDVLPLVNEANRLMREWNGLLANAVFPLSQEKQSMELNETLYQKMNRSVTEIADFLQRLAKHRDDPRVLHAVQVMGETMELELAAGVAPKDKKINDELTRFRQILRTFRGE